MYMYIQVYLIKHFLCYKTEAALENLGRQTDSKNSKGALRSPDFFNLN